MVFRSNTSLAERRSLANLLNVTHMGTQDKYLRLPAIVNHSKRQTFNDLKMRAAWKVVGWKEKFDSLSNYPILHNSISEEKLSTPHLLMGEVKINFDAGLNKRNNLGSYGAVAFDVEQNFLNSHANRVGLMPLPFMMESLPSNMLCPGQSEKVKTKWFLREILCLLSKL
ncbi:conserved hypothetical protein [Ricinus communis]|uniref:Uncharacterized protein n=1 Tax=Ricinus communis TaxID=3988 RepID=B9S8E6_RICCO|nr:conserved hypothetical protein [Ricinus communis]